MVIEAHISYATDKLATPNRGLSDCVIITADSNWNLQGAEQMGFGFHSIEHAFGSVAKDIVKTASIFSLVASRVEKAAPEIEAITGSIYPPAVLIERAAFALLGTAAHTATTIGDATAAKGLNIPLDESSIKQLQQIAKFLETHIQSFKDTSLIEPPEPAKS